MDYTDFILSEKILGLIGGDSETKPDVKKAKPPRTRSNTKYAATRKGYFSTRQREKKPEGQEGSAKSGETYAEFRKKHFGSETSPAAKPKPSESGDRESVMRQSKQVKDRESVRQGYVSAKREARLKSGVDREAEKSGRITTQQRVNREKALRGEPVTAAKVKPQPKPLEDRIHKAGDRVDTKTGKKVGYGDDAPLMSRERATGQRRLLRDLRHQASARQFGQERNRQGSGRRRANRQIASNLEAGRNTYDDSNYYSE